jgi:hypothetical protein
LTELAEFGSAREALAARRTVATIVPKLIREGDKIRVIMEAE